LATGNIALTIVADHSVFVGGATELFERLATAVHGDKAVILTAAFVPAGATTAECFS
jgi:hypothetical protein